MIWRLLLFLENLPELQETTFKCERLEIIARQQVHELGKRKRVIGS